MSTLKVALFLVGGVSEIIGIFLVAAPDVALLQVETGTWRCPAGSQGGAAASQ